MSVGLIDTSIFCELLGVPGKSGQVGEIRAALRTKIGAGEVLLLPMTTIIETGNLIGQCSTDGGMRRSHAIKFVELVKKAIDGEAPFVPTQFPDSTDIRRWLDEFPAWTMRTVRGKGSGFGDLTIKEEWERQCLLNQARRVYIWSLDDQLTPYDRSPVL